AHRTDRRQGRPDDGRAGAGGRPTAGGNARTRTRRPCGSVARAGAAPSYPTVPPHRPALNGALPAPPGPGPARRSRLPADPASCRRRPSSSPKATLGTFQLIELVRRVAFGVGGSRWSDAGRGTGVTVQAEGNQAAMRAITSSA